MFIQPKPMNFKQTGIMKVNSNGKQVAQWDKIIEILNTFKTNHQPPYSFVDLYELDRELVGYLVKYKPKASKDNAIVYEETEKFYYSYTDLEFIFNYLGVAINVNTSLVDYNKDITQPNINGYSIYADYNVLTLCNEEPAIPICATPITRAVFGFNGKVANELDANTIETAKARAIAKVLALNTGLGAMCWTNVDYVKEQMKEKDNPDYKNIEGSSNETSKVSKPKSTTQQTQPVQPTQPIPPMPNPQPTPSPTPTPMVPPTPTINPQPTPMVQPTIPTPTPTPIQQPQVKVELPKVEVPPQQPINPQPQVANTNVDANVDYKAMYIQYQQQYGREFLDHIKSCSNIPNFSALPMEEKFKQIIETFKKGA